MVAQAVWASTAEGATFSRVGAGEREKCEKKVVFVRVQRSAMALWALKREARMMGKKEEIHPK